MQRSEMEKEIQMRIIAAFSQLFDELKITPRFINSVERDFET